MAPSFAVTVIIRYVFAVLSMAFFTLTERKLLGYFQLRKGPNKVGISGVAQPFSDVLKLFSKEHNFPARSNVSPYVVAPGLALVLAFLL